MRRREVIRYSQAFKREVVGELERGRFRSIREAAEHYGIRGGDTIPKWLKQHGKNHLIPRVVRVESMDERDRIKELEKKNEQLEKALAETKIEEMLNRAYLELVCEEHGIEDIEAFKKNADGKLFTAAGKGRKRSR